MAKPFFVKDHDHTGEAQSELPYNLHLARHALIRGSWLGTRGSFFGWLLSSPKLLQDRNDISKFKTFNSQETNPRPEGCGLTDPEQKSASDYFF